GLPLNAQCDRSLVARGRIEPGPCVWILGAVDDRAEILKADRRAVAVRNGHPLELFGVHQLSGGLQGVRLERSDDVSGRHVDVPRAKSGLDFVDADLTRGQGVRVELRVNRVLLRAEDLNLRDAADLRNAL